MIGVPRRENGHVFCLLKVSLLHQGQSANELDLGIKSPTFIMAWTAGYLPGPESRTPDMVECSRNLSMCTHQPGAKGWELRLSTPFHPGPYFASDHVVEISCVLLAVNN